MRDLAGVEDSDPGFKEIDTLTEQHVRETAERAVRTRRGTVREFQQRYVDLAGYVQSRSAEVPVTVLAGVVEDDLEADERVRRCVASFSPPNPMGRISFSIELTMADGTTLTTSGTA